MWHRSLGGRAWTARRWQRWARSKGASSRSCRRWRAGAWRTSPAGRCSCCWRSTSTSTAPCTSSRSGRARSSWSATPSWRSTCSSRTSARTTRACWPAFWCASRRFFLRLLFSSEPIMGKGLIPADPQTWKVRRRAIVPGFHKRWLNRMMRLFAECNEALLDQVGHAADEGRTLDMEEKFCSVSLDIIGRAVFNYDFGSTNKESPVIKAVYRVLREAEHRSSSFIPYWKLPFATQLLASQVEFSADMRLLNDVLDELISKAVATQQVADVEELESRDLDVAEDPSLLRFLIDMRGEDTTSKQLRDDLMTMLIAGHETTAAVLTWTLFNLAQNPELTARVQAEIDAVLGPDRLPEFDDLAPLQLTRLALVEALRLYPEPPVLIRRALREDALPPGGTGTPIRLPRGSDVFISTWNLHRSPALWDAPQEYNPERFMRPHSNSA
eukprot:TRINITY_DN869_c0_g3_i6.p1 TRINITY_DN869_c0_g3~~TRINITY_DN869_c0_g3_i6.p1  ORF type:complete len:441 (+),score=103.47 TRINITY_DN869_c0_g3_i6:750-2072(+)